MAKRKFSKEVINKFKFWVMLGVSIACSLVCIHFVSDVRTQADTFNGEAKRNKIQADTIRNDPNLRGELSAAVLKAQADEASQRKDALLRKLYDEQQDVVRDGEKVEVRNPLILWPNTPNFRDFNKKDFGEYLGVRIMDIEYARDSTFQWYELVQQFPLVNERAQTGAVRIRSEGVAEAKPHPQDGVQLTKQQALMLTMLEPVEWKRDERILPQDAWMVQEDYSIKREFVGVISETLDIVGLIRPEWRRVAAPGQAKPEPATPAAAPTPTPGKPIPTKPIPTKAIPVKPDKPGEEKPEDTKPKSKDQTFDHKLFYNTSWYVPDPEVPVPLTDQDGWLIDLTLRQAGDEVRLEGSNLNRSKKKEHKVPNSNIKVRLSNQAGTVFTEVLVTGAGDLEPDEGKRSRKLIAESVPNDARKIVGVRSAPVSKDKPMEQPIYTFRGTNNYWTVEMNLSKDRTGIFVLSGKLINRSGRRLIAPAFVVKLEDETGKAVLQDVLPDLEPINALQTGFFQQTVARSEVDNPIMISEVRQILDFRTAPIKRIDLIRAGRGALEQADRIWTNEPVVAYFFDRKDPTVPSGELPTRLGLLRGAPPPGANPQQQPGKPTPTPGKPPPGKPVPGGSASFNANPERQQSVVRERYFAETPPPGATGAFLGAVSDDFRRVPISMVLVIEDRYILDLLTHLSRSRLNFQAVHSVWNRHPALGNPFGQEVKPIAKGEVPSAQRVRPQVTDEEGNLVEFQVYGLITIYENPDAMRGIEAERAKQASKPPPGKPDAPGGTPGGPPGQPGKP